MMARFDEECMGRFRSGGLFWAVATLCFWSFSACGGGGKAGPPLFAGKVLLTPSSNTSLVLGGTLVFFSTVQTASGTTLNTPVTYEQTKPFAHELARILERQHPQIIVSDMKKSLRAGKVFVDWSQNDDHKTTVCVYSLRAKEEPTVSTPVTWSEVENCLKKKKSELLKFRSDQVLARVKKLGDLFEPVEELKQKLPKKWEL